MAFTTPISLKLAILTFALILAGTVTFRLGYGNRTQACLDAPRKGDIYMVRLNGPRTTSPVYTLVQVESVGADRVIARTAQERSPSKRRIYRALAKAVTVGVSFRAGESVAYLRASLPDLHMKGVILVAKRGRS